jgi:hypothetical protein
MTTDILPLAFTMMVGPQIMSAIIFVTTDRPVRTSLAFIGGVLAATAAGVAIMLALGSLLGNSVDLGDPSDPSSTGHVIQYVLVGLLILAALKNYLNREQAEPPKWLGSPDDRHAPEGALHRPVGDPAHAVGHRGHADGGHQPCP